MHSLNSSFNKVFYLLVIALVVVGAIMLLLNIVPIILVAVVSVWILTKAFKFVKGFARKFAASGEKDTEEIVMYIDEFDLTGKNIIDVEYREV